MTTDQQQLHDRLCRTYRDTFSTKPPQSEETPLDRQITALTRAIFTGVALQSYRRQPLANRGRGADA